LTHRAPGWYLSCISLGRCQEDRNESHHERM